MTCRELVTFLMEYVDGTLAAVERSRFDQHLAGCPHCVAYVESYRQTIRIGKALAEAPDTPVPSEVPEELVQAILSSRRQG